jgi:hypothetical protein
MLIPFGVFSAAGAGGGGGGVPAYEQIATTLVSSGQSSIVFSSIPQDYKHLQLRYVTKPTTLTYVSNTYLQPNGSTNFNNGWIHILQGNGSSASSNNISNRTSSTSFVNPGNGISGSFTAGITDILDYTSTSKNKVYRTLAGMHDSASDAKLITLQSSNVVTLSAITSLTFTIDGGTIAVGSRFSLYGIKG